MADIVGARVLDNGLAALDSECDKIFVCSAEPTTYAEASATFALGVKTFTAGVAFGAPATGSPNGRQVTSVPITDGIITATGTVVRWAAVDSVNSRLLAQGVVSGGGAVTLGQAFTLDAITIGMPASASYVGPGDIVSGALAWYGLRGYSAAYAAPGNNPAIDVVDTATGLITTTINILANGNLDQATISGLGYGVSITKFYDQSGNGRHVAQGPVSILPVLTVNGLGGTRPIAVWNGTDYLISAGNLSQSQPFVVSVVAGRTGAFTSEGDFMATLEGGVVTLGSYTSADTVFMYAGNVITAAATDSAYHAFQFTVNGASSEFYIDGSTTTGDAGATNFGPGLIRVGGTGSANLTGRLLEEGIWAGTMSSGQKSALNSQQHTYWGI